MDAWDRLGWLFDTDDGGLYDIRLMGLNESGLAAVLDFVRSRSAVSPDALFWHKRLECDQRVADYHDAARLVARGVAEPFHVLAPGLAFAGAVIPDLGVFVWTDEVTFDYRMGPEWGRPQLLGLFELLRQLAAMTGGQVSLGQHVPPQVDAQFVNEWQAYCASRVACADPGSAPARGNR